MIFQTSKVARTIGKYPDAGKDWGQEENGATGMRWLDDITEAMDMNLIKLQQMVKDQRACPGCSSWDYKVSEWLSNWKTIPMYLGFIVLVHKSYFYIFFWRSITYLSYYLMLEAHVRKKINFFSQKFILRFSQRDGTPNFSW